MRVPLRYRPARFLEVGEARCRAESREMDSGRECPPAQLLRWFHAPELPRIHPEEPAPHQPRLDLLRQLLSPDRCPVRETTRNPRPEGGPAGGYERVVLPRSDYGLGQARCQCLTRFAVSSGLPRAPGSCVSRADAPMLQPFGQCHQSGASCAPCCVSVWISAGVPHRTQQIPK